MRNQSTQIIFFGGGGLKVQTKGPLVFKFWTLKNLFKKSICIYLKIHVQFWTYTILPSLKKMIKHITKRGRLNRLRYCFLVLPKVYMNSGSTHKDEVGRIWDLFKLSWAALNLSMSIMLLHWPCCFFSKPKIFFFVLRFRIQDILRKVI